MFSFKEHSNTVTQYSILQFCMGNCYEQFLDTLPAKELFLACGKV